MKENSIPSGTSDTELFAGKAWFDPIDAGIRDRVRGFIQELLEQELTAALGRRRHERVVGDPIGYRNGTRERQLLGSFGPTEISVPRRVSRKPMEAPENGVARLFLLTRK